MAKPWLEQAKVPWPEQTKVPWPEQVKVLWREGVSCSCWQGAFRSTSSQGRVR